MSLYASESDREIDKSDNSILQYSSSSVSISFFLLLCVCVCVCAQYMIVCFRQASIRVTYQGGSDVVQSFYYMADTTYNFILKLAGSSQPAGSNSADVAGIPGIILILL